ncbi:MAG: cyclic nucleotide-binding domain-containing protein [Candidatus Binatia bacterium]
MAETTLDLFRHAKDFELFAQGQTIFQEGDPGEVMYVVIEGEVDILVGDQVLASLGPGGILGEMALIDKQARSATAVAKTDCKLTPVDERRFRFLIQQTPNFALSVMRVMAGRLRSMNMRI